MLLDESFSNLLNKFVAENAKHFDGNSEENKLIYTDIFKQYVCYFHLSFCSCIFYLLFCYSIQKSNTNQTQTNIFSKDKDNRTVSREEAV